MAEKVDYIPFSQEHHSVSLPQNRAKSSLLTRVVRISAVAAIMLLGIRAVLPSSNFSRLGRAAGCGGHRKLVNDAKLKLPAHYSLPSGDQIPSVALGATTDFKSNIE
jgi:hypothetical protein